MPVFFEKHEERWIAKPIRRKTERRPGETEDFDLPPQKDAAATTASAPRLIRADRDGRAPQWALLAGPDPARGTLHNGQPVTAGLRVLAHRDSLSLEGGATAFFSTEEPARIETFAGPEKATCPRCRDAITMGQAAVRCPSCGVVHHESAERNCWTYAKTCAVCAQPTALDAGLQWTPDGL